MKILVYVEHFDGRIGGMTAELLTVARDIASRNDGHVEAFLASADPTTIKGSLAGADVVVEATDPAFADYEARSQGLALQALIEARAPDLLLFGYTTCGLDLAPWLAARLKIPMAAYCTSFRVDRGNCSATAQIYGGKLLAEVALPLPAIAMMAPGAAGDTVLDSAEPKREAMVVPNGIGERGVKVVSVQTPDPEAIDISAATKLVSVGRGIGDEGNIEEARDLAGALGAQLVSSRPLVDIGWFPKERQVGKSGRKVKPQLYLALGISGAPEHLEGMAASDLIIAVNTDANAPIFQVAHFGAVADCLELIPELQKALESRGLGNA